MCPRSPPTLYPLWSPAAHAMTPLGLSSFSDSPHPNPSSKDFIASFSLHPDFALFCKMTNYRIIPLNELGWRWLQLSLPQEMWILMGTWKHSILSQINFEWHNFSPQVWLEDTAMGRIPSSKDWCWCVPRHY